MSDAQHTSLLDDYLQKTAACQASNPYRGRQQLETLVLDNGDDASLHPSLAPTIAGHTMLRDVHQALDEVLAAATGSPATAAGRQASAVATQQSYSTARAAVHQQHKQQQAGLARSQASADTASSTLGKQCGSSIFRAMRQADAAALYSQRFKRDQEDRGQEQQPVLVAPSDGANAAVRVIASNAALQAKLAKLQADIEARSYRRELLQQLQRPSALFQQQQQHQQLRCHHHGHRRSMDTIAADASNQVVDSAAHRNMFGQFSIMRPATSPALVGVSGFSDDPTAAYSSAATMASSRHSSILADDGVVQPVRTKGSGVLPGTPGSLAAAQQQQQQQRLKHLQELAEYELPWKAAAPAVGKAGDSNVHNKCVTAKQQARPWTSAGGATELQARCASGGASSGSNGLQSLAATPRGHSNLAGSRLPSLEHHHQQQGEQRRQEHVQRPASAVAALQQSLSELAKFKVSVQQHQQEQQQHACMRQQTASQQHHHQHTQHSTDLGLSCIDNSSGLSRQQPHSSTWLPERSLQHLHEAPIHPGRHIVAASAAAAGEHGLLQGRAASAGGGWVDRHANRMRSVDDDRRRSSTASFGLWDSWQEQVHDRAAAAAAARASHCYGSCSLGGAFACSSSPRARSVPRPLRAWDVLPLPREPAAAAPGRARQRSCDVSSPVKLTGHLQQLRQQRHLQQEQRRPMTAAAAPCSLAHTPRAGSSARPFGLHNSHVVYAAGGGTAAAAAAAVPTGSSANKSHASSSSAWLVSSPLKRAQQFVATSARPRSSSGGGSSAAANFSVGGAAGRARTAAAGLFGVQAPGSALQAVCSTGGGLNNADDKRLLRLRATTPAAVSSAAAQPGHGKAASATAQLLQQVRAQQQSRGGARVSCSGASLADKVAAAASGMRSSGGGSSSSSAAGPAPLTAQILEYAAGLYTPARSKRRPSDSCSTTSSGSSDASDSSNLAPAARDKQAAYAAALARVRAAKQANRRHDSDDDSS